MADHGFHAEAIQHRAEQAVVVEAVDERRIAARFVAVAVDDALIEVGRAQAPDAACKRDVVRIVDLAQVIE
jgi:hypothetical protein